MNRIKGIGGTDISAIVGMNPFKTPLDVWLDKTGQAEETPDNENMWWGREMEPVLAKRYEKETGSKVYLPPVGILPYRLPTPNWYLGSPDGLINPMTAPYVPKSEGGVDFKTSGRPQEWGEPGTDDIPQQYIIQAEWYMGLTGAQWWDVAVLLMGFTRKFAIYRVHRDEELIGDLTAAGEKFWKDHVLAGVAPPLDGSKSATEYLKRLYPQDQGPILEPTDEDILQKVKELRQVRGMINHYEKHESILINRLKSIIGDCAGMKGEWGKIYWKKNRDSVKVDWEAAFHRMARIYETEPAEVNAIIAQETKIQPGARVFRPYWAKED